MFGSSYWGIAYWGRNFFGGEPAIPSMTPEFYWGPSYWDASYWGVSYWPGISGAGSAPPIFRVSVAPLVPTRVLVEAL